MRDKIIVVWFSCGCPSAVAAKKTIEMYGKDNTVMVVNNPVKEEDDDNQFELLYEIDWHVMGYTLEEKAKRHDVFVARERSNLLPVLIDLKLTKDESFEIVLQAGIEIPLAYRLGYPNANCIGCVKATSSTYWNHVRRTHPEVFAARAEQSRRIGTKLVRHNGKRIFLDELPLKTKGAKLKSYECSIFCNHN